MPHADKTDERNKIAIVIRADLNREAKSAMKQHTALIVFLYMSLIGFAIASAHAAPSTAITFGIVPQQSTMKLAKLWVPVLQLNFQFTVL